MLKKYSQPYNFGVRNYNKFLLTLEHYPKQLGSWKESEIKNCLIKTEGYQLVEELTNSENCISKNREACGKVIGLMDCGYHS